LIDKDLEGLFSGIMDYHYLGIAPKNDPDYRIVIQAPLVDQEEPTYDVSILSHKLTIKKTTISARRWLKDDNERWQIIKGECVAYVRHCFKGGEPKSLAHSQKKTSIKEESRGDETQLDIEVVGQQRPTRGGMPQNRTNTPFETLDLELSPEYLWKKARAKPPNESQQAWNLTMNAESGMDSNPSQTATSEGPDGYFKSSLSGSWAPIHNHLFGYTLFSQSYFDQDHLNVLAHLLNYGHSRSFGQFELGIKAKGLSLSLDHQQTLTQWGISSDLKVPVSEKLKFIFTPHLEESSYMESLAGMDGNQYGAFLGAEVGLGVADAKLTGGLKASKHNSSSLDYEKWMALVGLSYKGKVNDLSFSNSLSLEYGERDDSTLTLGLLREDRFLSTKYEVLHALKYWGGINLGFQAQYQNIQSNIFYADTSRSIFSLQIRKAW